eukprot:TRINITY_DN8377_c0_g1_i1.p1 TRINITY_DN8377_c0_g1~~TRINITY_DN8377_c0_g1_i1.p1  ORF type:complete len:384 (-),score=87.10 TRINITY_DN8377_c0_g1_i1:3-1031(-)
MSSGISGIDFGLLKFCLEHTDSPNLVDNPLPNRDPADYEWLKKALQNLESDTTRMKNLLGIIKGNQDEPKKEGEQSKSQNEGKEGQSEGPTSNKQVSDEVRRHALEELQFYVEDIDNANDLVKIGGIPVLLDCLSPSSPSSIRYWALWVVASAVQNNPNTQAKFLLSNFLEVVFGILREEKDSDVGEKALYALSGLIRDNDGATHKFIQDKGVYLLSEILHISKREKLLSKVLFMIANLLGKDPKIKQDVPFLHSLLVFTATLITHDNIDIRENAQKLLLEVIQVNTNALLGFELEPLLRDRIKHITSLVAEERDIHQEELNILLSIVKLLLFPKCLVLRLS